MGGNTKKSDSKAPVDPKQEQDPTTPQDLVGDEDPSIDLDAFLANQDENAQNEEVIQDAAVDSGMPDALETQLVALKEQLSEMEERWKRAKAETENTRRRSQEEVSKAQKFSIEKFANELLVVKDSMEAALSNQDQSIEDLQSGVELTLKQLEQIFERSGIREVNSVKEKFDPNVHQAIGTVDSEQPANTVVAVLQKGYLIADRVLRPAMVTISKGSES